MPIEPGTVLGGEFRIVSRLGQGGMGSVWVAEQLSVGRKRAIKVMRPEIAEDPRLRERFALEARIGATIESDHVVEVVAAGIDEALDAPWLAMELLDGQDLEAAVARGRLSCAEVAAIAEQLCHAVAAAHAAGVVHRDLKPENVFLARSRRSGAAPFEVKVLDFGIAKLAAEARATSAASLVLGTPLYMAPEQAEPGTTPTPAMDVWALGLIVYRALTGRYFWRSAREGSPTITALLREVLFDPIPAASVRVAEDALDVVLPPGFDAWLARCLEREPTARWEEAGRAWVALRAVLRGEASPLAQTMSAPETPPSLSARSQRTPNSATPSGVSSRSGVARHAPSGVVEVHADDDFSLGRVSDIVIIRWWKTPHLASTAVMDRALRRAIHEHGGGPCVVMPVIDAKLPSPHGEARAALARSMENHDREVRRVAYIVFGEGFGAATLRGVITGLTLVVRPTHKTQVFATVGEAATALVKDGASAISRGDLAAAIGAFTRLPT